MTVRISSPPGWRLAEQVSGPGGVTVNEAVAAAERGIKSIEARGLEEIAQTVARMQRLGRSLAGARTDQDAAALYAASNTLLGVAAAFGLPSLGDVAFSLCALLEQFSLSGQWRMAPVQLHLDALALLHAGGAPHSEIAGMIAALRQIVDHMRAAPLR